MLHQFPKGGFPHKGIAAPKPPPPVRAALYGDDLLIGLDEPMKGTRGEFIRDADGADRLAPPRQPRASAGGIRP